jgi:ferredoxin
MANPKKRHPRNLPGPFYVDDACITHNSCVLDAPEHFALDPATGTAYVKRQPVTPEEVARCWKALDGCPVSAIGCTEARPQGTGPKTEEAGSSGKKPWWRFW